jgi:hypothetical protein
MGMSDCRKNLIKNGRDFIVVKPTTVKHFPR